VAWRKFDPLPRDLTQHRCIGWRLSVEAASCRWKFTEDGRDFAVTAAPNMTINDMALLVKMTRAGGGPDHRHDGNLCASACRGATLGPRSLLHSVLSRPPPPAIEAARARGS
jgi:hypothetical protein